LVNALADYFQQHGAASLLDPFQQLSVTDTTLILEHLGRPLEVYESLDNLCKDVVASFSHVRIPVPMSCYRRIPESFKILFEVGDCGDLIGFINNLVTVRIPTFGELPVSAYAHMVYGQLFELFLKCRGFGYETRGDTFTKDCLSTRSKPDHEIAEDSYVWLRGEHKKKSITDAKQDLLDKLLTNVDPVYYMGQARLIVYAMTCEQVEFFDLDRSALPSSVEAMLPAKSIYLSDIGPRLESAFCFIQCFRLGEYRRRAAIERLRKIPRFTASVPDKPHITYEQHHVKKKVALTDGTMAVYNLINSTPNRPFSLCQVTQKDNMLFISPIGIDQKPSTDEQWCSWLANMLTALEWLHQINVVHRDIRWPNIRFRPELDGQREFWFLIDLELAAVLENGVSRMPQTTFYKKIGGEYAKKDDLEMLRILADEAACLQPCMETLQTSEDAVTACPAVFAILQQQGTESKS
jgi:hypothetical protein